MLVRTAESSVVVVPSVGLSWVAVLVQRSTSIARVVARTRDSLLLLEPARDWTTSLAALALRETDLAALQLRRTAEETPLARALMGRVALVLVKIGILLCVVGKMGSKEQDGERRK